MILFNQVELQCYSITAVRFYWPLNGRPISNNQLPDERVVAPVDRAIYHSQHRKVQKNADFPDFHRFYSSYIRLPHFLRRPSPARKEIPPVQPSQHLNASPKARKLSACSRSCSKTMVEKSSLRKGRVLCFLCFANVMEQRDWLGVVLKASLALGKLMISFIVLYCLKHTNEFVTISNRRNSSAR